MNIMIRKFGCTEMHPARKSSATTIPKILLLRMILTWSYFVGIILESEMFKRNGECV